MADRPSAQPTFATKSANRRHRRCICSKGKSRPKTILQCCPLPRTLRDNKIRPPLRRPQTVVRWPMTTAVAPRVFPPAPKVHAADLPAWRLLPAVARSSLSFWPERAFDFLINKHTMLGITSIVVNDPEGVRHFLVGNAANYRRPSSVRRVTIPLGGSGLFLAEGAEWRRQRKLLAPTLHAIEHQRVGAAFPRGGAAFAARYRRQAGRQSLEGVPGYRARSRAARLVLDARKPVS